MYAFAVSASMGTKDSVFVACRHFVFFWELKRSLLRTNKLESRWEKKKIQTREAHCTPLARTASITASTFLSLWRALAFLVIESFHGIFLYLCENE